MKVMQNDSGRKKYIEGAIHQIDARTTNVGDGKWFEILTRDCAFYIQEWEIQEAWRWDDWPEKDSYYNGSPPDSGIDVVGRRSDGELVAIQCKARSLDVHGHGPSLSWRDVSTFYGLSAHTIYAERWVVVNGDVPFGKSVIKEKNQPRPLKHVNLKRDLVVQLEQISHGLRSSDCPCCIDKAARQTRDCMQHEAITKSVRILKEHASFSGTARGKIILPCGTGKTRIALRIIEQLTPHGECAVILCPSISLVSQIRSEFLNHAAEPIRVMAVCSDETAVRGTDLKKNPMFDTGQLSASEIKGIVSTDPDFIAEWMKDVRTKGEQVGVIVSTYQSSFKIATALAESGQKFTTMVADEAHRTAGLRRIPKLGEKLRDFTICHYNYNFPVKYRIYQTATPKIYEREMPSTKGDDWIVRDMDDQNTFGVDLYRRSYVDAVNNDWLSDYRIIAIAVNDDESWKVASKIIADDTATLDSHLVMRALALALVMGGGLAKSGVKIKSSINFVNSKRNSRAMERILQSENVRGWLQRHRKLNGLDGDPPEYSFKHLDAESSSYARENAKTNLKTATEEAPYGVVNCKIFGEGVDAPSLSAVSFLETRSSAVDVVQAVGRVMRKVKGKRIGYVFCPIVIPPNIDAETFLRNSRKEDGWRELGDVLLALRAHDKRIEDELAHLFHLYVPSVRSNQTDDEVCTVVATPKDGQVAVFIHTGQEGDAVEDAAVLVSGRGVTKGTITPLDISQPVDINASCMITSKQNEDGSIEQRESSTPTHSREKHEWVAKVDIDATRKKARDMLNRKAGRKISQPDRYANSEKKDTTPMFKQLSIDEVLALSVNLLERSGISADPAQRDVNILKSSIKEATHCLHNDEVGGILDRHFKIDRHGSSVRSSAADGCTIASLLLLNVAMLHQRIALGGWFKGISDLREIMASTDTAMELYDQWNEITRYDFIAVIKPAIKIIQVLRKAGKLAGLNSALRHLVGRAVAIAESYGKLGVDYAGVLFNEVMGNQQSDGAYFTGPSAATLLSRLVLDVSAEQTGPVDWKKEDTWRDHRTVDLACGSGTLLGAMLTEMKRRAREQEASEDQLEKFQKLAVEELIAGLDINEVSLQLAATYLMADNRDVTYRKLNMYQMPFGPLDGGGVAWGTLELLSHSQILPRIAELRMEHDKLNQLESASLVLNERDDPTLDTPVDACKDVRVVIMNPPFTATEKMGTKWESNVRDKMMKKVQGYRQLLRSADPQLDGFTSGKSIGPLFDALAHLCVDKMKGIFAMVSPTILCSSDRSEKERKLLARHFHLHTIVTSHVPSDASFCQGTGINDSLYIFSKYMGGGDLSTRIISLDRMPHNQDDVAELHQGISKCREGLIVGGWGEVSSWKSEYVAAGNWIAALWRSTRLADWSMKIANSSLPRLCDFGSVYSTGQQIRDKKKYTKSDKNTPWAFPVIKSAGAEGQKTIRAIPDGYYAPVKNITQLGLSGGHPDADKMYTLRGHLLISATQNRSSARLMAVASENPYVGGYWYPVQGLTIDQAMAAAVYFNSTVGRVYIHNTMSRTLGFPQYPNAGISKAPVPDLADRQIVDILLACYTETVNTVVPQFRDGECDVRRKWDEAVATALSWDSNELKEMRMLLHEEPYVRGVARGELR